MTTAPLEPKPIIAFDLSGTLADVLPDSPKDHRGLRVELAVPGGREFLERLRENYRVIVVSGGKSDESLLALEALGVDPRDAYLETRYKGELLEDLKANSGVVAYVGDGAHDVEGPAAVGIPVVVFRWDRPDNPAARARVRGYYEGELATRGLGDTPFVFGFTDLASALRSLGVEVLPASGSPEIGELSR